MVEPNEEPNEVVAGELLPHDDTVAAMALAMGIVLSPLSADLADERRDLAVELRRLFVVLRISVRRYAALRHHSPSSVSRYLSGETVASDPFVTTLMDDVGRELGRPLSGEARGRVTALQRAALRAGNPRAAKVQELEDRLVAAHTDAKVARTQADAVATLLHAERQRVAGLEEERQELARALEVHQATGGAELEVLRAQQHRVHAERDELRSRVADLEAALAAAERRVAVAEQRCTELERELEAADAVAAAEESASAAERNRERHRAELDALREEVARWRAAAEGARESRTGMDDASPAGNGDPWVLTPVSAAVAAGPTVRPDAMGVSVSVTIVHVEADRLWVDRMASRLGAEGRFVRVVRWSPKSGAGASAELGRLLEEESGRVLLLLSDEFLAQAQATLSPPQWRDTFLGLAAEQRARLAAVHTGSTDVPVTVMPLRPLELHGLDEDMAFERVRALVDLPAAPADDVPAPDVWSGVPRRNTRFTGREALLADTHRALRGAEPGAGVLTLCGMAGVGKTQIAVEYVYRFAADYDMVWWVEAKGRSECRRRLAELASVVRRPTGPGRDEPLHAVRDALRRGTPYARWLLILDGADEPDRLSDLVPSGPGHVLITSCNPEWGEHNSMLTEVPVYERDESTAFIRRRAPRLTVPEADRLAEALEDLPLLLDQTAGWLRGSDISVEAYLRQLDGGLDQDAIKVSADSPLSFRTAWAILLEKLREAVPESLDLLRLFTFFAPGWVPVRLLKGMPRDGIPERIAALLDNPLLWHKAVNQLRRYSIVRVEPSAPGSTESFYLHRMVHRTVRDAIPDEDRRELADVARSALTAADPAPPDDARQWGAYAEIVPHLEHADVFGAADPAAQRLALNCLAYLHHCGRYDEGLALAGRAMDTWRQSLGETHPRVWELTDVYTGLLSAVGKHQRAAAINRAAVDRLREEDGRSLAHLRAVGGLAAELQYLAHHSEALELSQSYYTACGELTGPQDPRTFEALNRVGHALRALGRYEEALDAHRRAWEGLRSTLGDRYMWTLAASRHHATDLRLLGRYTEAGSYLEPTAAGLRTTCGPDHPLTLRAEHSLALSLMEEGDPAKADGLLERVLDRAEQQLGESSPLTLVFAASRSCFALAFGDLVRARSLSESVVAGTGAMFSEGHPCLVGARANHALVLLETEERDHAQSLLEETLTAMSAAVGADHPWTLGCAINTATVRTLFGDLEGAASLDKDTIYRAAKALGRRHPLTLAARVAYAADLRGLRQRKLADEVEREALSALEATQGPQHVKTVQARKRHRPYWAFELQPS